MMPGPSHASRTRRAALAAGAAAVLASCGPRPLFASRSSARLDVKRLDQGFPALADRARPGAFAMGVMNLETAETWYWNMGRGFPLAGAFQIPLAAAALSEVEERELALTERVAFSALDLSAPFSAINQKWPTPPDGYAASIPASTLFTLTLLWGDNTAADVLMQRIGGPSRVGAFLQQKTIEGVRVDRYARELAVESAGMPTFRPDWKDLPAFLAARDAVAPADRQAAMDAYVAGPRDTATVPGALELLRKLVAGELVSAGATAQLIKWMEAARGGERRLKAGLPAGARFAHKASAAATDLGFTPAVADLGVATWPDGRRFAVAAFLAGSTGAEAQRDSLFADAARLIVAAAG
jgi:beta-lactamase class A